MKWFWMLFPWCAWVACGIAYAFGFEFWGTPGLRFAAGIGCAMCGVLGLLVELRDYAERELKKARLGAVLKSVQQGGTIIVEHLCDKCPACGLGPSIRRAD